MNYINKLRSLLNRKAKYQLLWMLAFSIFVSVIETLGISVIMPFIDVATNFDTIDTNKYYKYAFDFFGFEKKVNFAIAFGVFLLGFYLFRGVVNLAYIYTMERFAQNLNAEIKNNLFTTYLKMPYQLFVNRNSSYLTKTILSESTHVKNTIQTVLSMISEVFTVIFLYTLMLIASWKITLLFTFILAVKLLFLTKTVSKRIKAIGTIRATIERRFFENINKVFNNFKHIKLQNQTRLDGVNDEFYQLTDKTKTINLKSVFLSRVPRIFLETTGFGLVILLLVFMLYKNQTSVLYILPTLSLFVLALYRLLPSINSMMTGYNTLMLYHKSVDIISEELNIEQEHLTYETIAFNQSIVLQNISFYYQENQPVLTDINLTINKGDKVAFIGQSGVGKSTLADLIIGIYQPNKGSIKIDNQDLNTTNLQDWRSQIGYIPQQIYLFDGTVADNVCFGRKLDTDLLEQVLKQANIFDFLQTKQGINTLVGEGGIQLSGGQKQRVAIARALYGSPEILVLDEATSALDTKIEQKIMDEIYQISHNRTLIIIAHRLSTIHGCNKIYEIKNGIIDKLNSKKITLKNQPPKNE